MKFKGLLKRETYKLVDHGGMQKHKGDCSVARCLGELACKDTGNDTHSCVCVHDSKPPTANGSCTRIIVPMEPSILRDVKLPAPTNESSNNTTTPPVVQQSSIINTTPYTNYYLVGASLIFILGIVIISVIIRRTCLKRRNSLASPISLKQTLMSSKRYTPNPQYTQCSGPGVPLLRKETLKFLNEIGEGCFGKVFKGEYYLGETDKYDVVAIKVLKENATKEAEEDFLREVEIMSAFRHPNILLLLGVVPREGSLNPMMVFEYMPHGDLAEVLRSQRRSSYDENVPELTKKDLLFVALQIARGMSYLAAQRFVHRDLACRNCLVADGPIVKIADFGMSRDVYTCDYYKIGGSRLLPVRWMSPESVIYGRFTLDSDIWSYGVVLWEIYSYGRQPYYGHTNEEVVKLVLEGVMLIPSSDCPNFISDLMKCCWRSEPKDRIRFAHICDKLEAIFDNVLVHDTYHIDNERDRLLPENTFKQRGTTTKKPLPRPPPIPLIDEDILDNQGYLLPKEIDNPPQYLETFPG